MGVLADSLDPASIHLGHRLQTIAEHAGLVALNFSNGVLDVVAMIQRGLGTSPLFQVNIQDKGAEVEFLGDSDVEHFAFDHGSSARLRFRRNLSRQRVSGKNVQTVL